MSVEVCKCPSATAETATSYLEAIVKVGLDALRADIVSIMQAHGVPPEEAEVGAEMCLDAEVRAHRAHGVRLLRNVLTEYVNGADRRRGIEIVAETAVSAQLDGGFHLSWFIHRMAVDIAVRKATDIGIALVSVRNAGVSGALGYLVERIADAELVGIAANSSPVTVVAPGAAVATLGTNPVAIGVPRQAGSPLVLDMATSAVAYNEILRLRATGGALPAGVATDANGELTTDPAAAIDTTTGRGRILPFGGHRGYGLALMIELLVSAGVTGRVGEDKRGVVIAEPADFSAVYLAYRPSLVGDPTLASQATDRLLDELNGQGVRIPGEASRRRREACLRDGSLELNDDATEVLNALKRPTT